ncbi:hypothetical protein SELMODRAFT_412073 [Selaginella moellendorffii]|uniref:Peptidase S8/S53 domain-containing protein n=1 Tax=Selaginella moellendorffii TaxID=88036 RepID=D8RJZ2_SELML|nr:hypothetical protein SELMODRAFT_412073 [Selaginella moellendorffii]
MIFYVLLWFFLSVGIAVNQEIYIVYLGGTQGIDAQRLSESHHEILSRATGSLDSAKESMIHSYRYSFSGFSARLDEEQAELLSRSQEVLSIYPSKTYQIQTTRSWDFLGLTDSMVVADKENHEAAGSYNVIVGLLDTGIWPESQSFRDDDMTPVPSRWRGECVNPPGINSSFIILCNRKLIGAKFFNSRVKSPEYGNARDDNGHGTHTASTATGRLVSNASMQGLARGTARGGVPLARLAIYKVCWGIGCEESDILAGYDAAVGDGVDVISVSIGGPAVKYSLDGLAIGAYHAVEKGVAVAAGAGNFGIWTMQVINAAPWIFTIAASTIDRSIDKAKPDVTAPGVDILAAWPSGIAVPGFNGGTIYSDYALLSGTSMSTPHAGGALAFVKSVHPSWSPAALKSALMTTATTLDNTNQTIKTSYGEPATLFSYGSGQIQPAKALDPGLVYDIEPTDYISYLCSTGYSSAQVRNITGDKSTACSTNSTFDLNYPSIGIARLDPGESNAVTVARTLTSVGSSPSDYRASVDKPSDARLSVVVEPETLRFGSSGAKLSFKVAVTLASSSGHTNATWIYSALIWSDGVHRVRSPIAVLASSS